MVSATPKSFTSLASSSSHSYLFPKLSNRNPFTPKHVVKYKLWVDNNGGNRLLHRSRSEINSVPRIPSFSCAVALPSDVVAAADKLNQLVSEFRSLSEPIDRVKRLLHFAALLPPLDESARVPENRVKGCTTQVWLIAEMDECGRMRFRADSDSEISKGFCWCLIWILDGAEPEEVLTVAAEDLAEMNVGLHVKAQSRVNTWHNILFSMQKATREKFDQFVSPSSCNH
ncbi:sufE-like protein 2, chloroplastic [Prosopis cineraria]|uniref:sufE-like protein 2, chloroplastic n=1 Tax=Prosopis cineraria TaxID=364024 RepID=UPI00240F2974|nr:sufE-like protein 2, chloroplastic [Prosopis cineraria]XP_054807298.1 sufE-like protein 2, chloroplastic [Prosopis cineraria]